jgi:hypothetical protein
LRVLRWRGAVKRALEKRITPPLIWELLKEGFQEKRYMKILLDTNILVHAYNKSSPHQDQPSMIIKKAIQSEITAYLSPQHLYEFFVVVMCAKRVPHPMLPREAATSALTCGNATRLKN